MLTRRLMGWLAATALAAAPAAVNAQQGYTNPSWIFGVLGTDDFVPGTVGEILGASWNSRCRIGNGGVAVFVQHLAGVGAVEEPDGFAGFSTAVQRIAPAA